MEAQQVSYDTLDQYAGRALRTTETWVRTDGSEWSSRSLYHVDDSKGKAEFKRCFALTPGGTSAFKADEVLQLMDASLRENSLVPRAQLGRTLEQLGPALAGVVFHRYLTQEDWAPSRQRLKKMLVEKR